MLERPSRGDFLVEIVDHGDVHGCATRFDPVFTQLVPVPGVYRLHGVAEFVEYTHEHGESPAFSAHGLPDFAVVLERAEGYQRVVTGASA